MKNIIPILCAALATTAFATAAEKKSETRQPDNTAINERDREAISPTAQEQGTSEADRDLTAKVRRAVMQDDQLSGYAKNVKIITKDGRVTLRGPVRTHQEKAAIAKKAQEAAGGHEVKDQLEVTQPASQEQGQHERK